MRAAALALAAMLVASPAAATETEAEVIYAIYEAWGDAPGANTARYLDELDALYADASPPCKEFISGLFMGIGMYGVGVRHSPDNHLGSEYAVTFLLTNVEKYDLACRIGL